MEQTPPIPSQLALQDLSYLPFLFSCLAFLFGFLGLSIDVAVNVVRVVDPNDATREKQQQQQHNIVANGRFGEKKKSRETDCLALHHLPCDKKTQQQ
jgi:hypothetical protein